MIPQSNFEKWRYRMEGCWSPDNYIDWGYYYLISAALQRRVWYGPDHMKLFCNQYTILVGSPAIGKGLVIQPVASMLKHHKLPDPATLSRNLEKNAQSETDKQVAQTMAEADNKLAQKENDKYERRKDKIFEKPLLFPVAADATTYEALVTAMAKAIRGKTYVKSDPLTGKNVMGTYLHSSLCFCLEEISSLFRKHTEDTVNFLIRAYDCNDYEKDTKTMGKDRVRKPCLNFFGGTQPEFMQTLFSDALLTQGFASRSFFIYAAKNRFEGFFIPELNADQKDCERLLLEHIEKLSHLYGEIILTKEARDFLEDWWRTDGQKRSNPNIRLDPYYGRKKVHVRKLAAAIHFSDNLTLEMGIEPFQKAIDILEPEEKRMHLGLGLGGDNPLAKYQLAIVRYLQLQGAKTPREILTEFWEKLPPPPKESLEELLSHLEGDKKIKKELYTNPKTKAQVYRYRVFGLEDMEESTTEKEPVLT